MNEPAAHEQDRIEQQLMALEDNPEAHHDSTVCNLHKELETLADDLKKPAPFDPHEAESTCRRAVEQVQTLASEQTAANASATADEGFELEPHTVIGQYEILGKIGQGGMGAVYKARHTKLDKIVALKLLPEERLEKSDALARFEREMKAVGKIEHPNLVRALDAGEADGSHFLVMEYVDGIDLSRLLKDYGKLPAAAACELVRQAAVGLEAAHHSGMVHRDIKPANLMLARQEFGPPVVKVLDLGLARLADDAGPLETELTADNQIMGTLDYMAPEQAGNSRTVDTRVDVYSLGATLFTLLTGLPPYHGPNHQTVMQKLTALATEPLPDIRNLRSDVPAGLVTVLEKMLAKDREKRYDEPGDVAEALKPFAANADVVGLLEDAKTMASTPNLARTTAAWAVPSTDATVGLPKHESRRPAFFASAVLLALAPLLFLYAGTILRFATNQGELVIEIDDPNIEVKVIQNGAVVQDKTKDREFTLTAADGQIEVLEKDGIKLATKEFQLTRGGKTIVKVSLQELADAQKPKPVSENKLDRPSSVPAENYALAFDGKDDYVELPVRLGRLPNFTIEVSCTPGDKELGDEQHAILARSGLFDLKIWGAGKQWASLIWDPDTLAPALAATQAYAKRTGHLAVQWDGASLSLFVDGKRAANLAVAKGAAQRALELLQRNPDAPLLLGAALDPAGKPLENYQFAGQIDEVRISKTARYTKNFTPQTRFEPDEHTLALYHFDEGAGDVLKDSSGNGHEGHIHGAKWLRVELPSANGSDRQVAEWALSLGGKVEYRKDKEIIRITTPSEIPAETFQIFTLDLVGIKELDDADLAKLTSLEDLNTVYLHATDIGDAGLAELAKIRHLGELHLNQTRVTDAGLAQLPQLQKLYLVFIAGTKITDAGVRNLTKQPNLRYLNLSGTEVTDVGAQTLSTIGNLRVVHLSDTTITDQGLKSLEKLKRLEEVVLKETKVTKAGVDQLHQGLPKSKIEWDGGVVEPEAEDPDRRAAEAVLKAGGSVHVLVGDDEVGGQRIQKIEELPAEPFRVIYVFFTNANGITDQNLAGLVGLKSLAAVHSHNTKITDAGLAHLAKLPSLKILNLYGTQVTDAGLAKLAALPRLGMLILSQTKVVAGGLDGLKTLTGVRELHVGGKMTRSRFLELAELKHLRRLLVSQAAEVTEADVARFHEKNPYCRVFVEEKLVGADPVREVAEELQKIGATLTLMIFGKHKIGEGGHEGYQDFPPDMPLPEGLFDVRAVSFYQNTTLKDEDLSRLHALPALYKVFLSSTNITDAGVEHLKFCRSIADLWLHRTKITDRSMEVLSELPLVWGLHIANTAITNEGVAKFATSDSLRVLEMSATRADGQVLESIAQMSKLTELHLQHLSINDDDLPKLYGLSALKVLSMNGTKVTAGGIEKLHEALPKCKITWDGGAVEPETDGAEENHP